MTTHARTVPGDIIRAFRRMTKFTPKIMSRQLGLPQKTLASYERDGAPEAIRYALLGLGLAQRAASKRELCELLSIPHHLFRSQISSSKFPPMEPERTIQG